MSKVMKAKDFVAKANNIVKNYKTLYVMGCFGAPLTETNKKRYTKNHSFNKQATRTNMINKASNNTFGFDCVCLIKGILWGWNGDLDKTYGGAVYKSNGVADMGADDIIKNTYCTNVSSDFNNIEVGEIVWLKGHVGIYIGNSQVIECTPAWSNNVQITKLSQRNWLKHGKLKYIDYENENFYTKKGYTGTFPSLGLKGYLRKGDKGTNVKRLQEFLNWCIGARLSVDGSFGPATLTAVKNYQLKYNLTVDGYFGPASLKKAKEIKK